MFQKMSQKSMMARRLWTTKPGTLRSRLALLGRSWFRKKVNQEKNTRGIKIKSNVKDPVSTNSGKMML